MKTYHIFRFGLMCLILLAVTGETTAQFSVDVELRPRYEIANGYRKLPTSDNVAAHYISQRSRISTSFMNGKFSGKLTFQDARLWGGENSLSLYESWVKYNVKGNHSFKIGRQELQYSDGRLIARRNWRQQGYTYDALLYQYTTDSLMVDVGITLNNSQENANGNLYDLAANNFKTFNFIHLKRKFSKNFDVSASAMVYGYQKPDTDTLYVGGTYGTLINYKTEKLSLKGEAYFQNGKNRDGLNTTAYLLGGRAFYKLTDKVTFGAGIDVLSGNDLSSSRDFSEENTAFSNLEGARFKYNGYSLMIRNTERNLNYGGLVNPLFELKVKMTDKLTSRAIFHSYSTQHEVVSSADATVTLDKNLGTELDVVADYVLKKKNMIRFGSAFVFPTASWEDIQGRTDSEFSFYFWLTFATKINAFKSK